MFKYAQIENSIVIGISFLLSEIDNENMILIDEDSNIDIGWQYINNEWIEPKIKETEPDLTENLTLEEIKELQLIQMQATVELYEKQQEDNLTIMSALAEIYEDKNKEAL